MRENKKINAGAQFLQTNVVFDPDGLEAWLNEIAKRNLLDKVYILVGIMPLKNLKTAHYMNNEIPGVYIPDAMIKRLEAAGDGVEEEGVQITLELIEAIRKKQGIHGIHLMAVGWEEVVPRIIREAGLVREAVTAINYLTQP